MSQCSKTSLYEPINLSKILLKLMKACKADLVGEGAGHDKGGVAGGTAQVEEAALGQHDHAVAVGEDEAVDLGLDVLPLHACTATAPPIRLTPHTPVLQSREAPPHHAAVPSPSSIHRKHSPT